MTENQVICVFGMGRSGTSALARVLSLCGACLPGPLIGPNPGNPAGHWEPHLVLRMNEEFLFNHGSSWYDPTLRLQADKAIDERHRDDFVEKIREFFSSCPSDRPLVIKEPRIVALSDFWFDGIFRAGYRLKIVVPVRHPSEVAASLATRDSTSLELSSALWLKYNLLAERKSRGLPRVFVEYSNLLNDWRREINRICQTLSVDLNDRDEAALDAFLTQDLHRERNDSPPIEVFDQPWLSGVYESFAAAARGEAVDVEKIDRVFSAYSVWDRTFRTSTNEFRNRFGGLAWASDLVPFLSRVQGQCAAEIAQRFGEELAIEGAGAEQTRAAFTRQAERVAEVQARLAATESASESLQKETLQMNLELDRRQRRLLQLEAELSDMQAQAVAFKSQIDAYEGSLSWRVTAPLRAIRRLAASRRKT